MTKKDGAIAWFTMLREKFTETEYGEYLDMAIKALEAWGKVEKDIHTAIDNALMHGYGDNYINACETILQIIQKQEKCLKMDKAEQTNALDKARAEIAAYGSIWVEYCITGHTDHDIEVIVERVLKQAKEQVLAVIDKYRESEDKDE